MDYGKFSKEELIKICSERNISFSSTWESEKLIEALINDDLKRENEKIIKANGVGRAGAIINIIFASIGIPFWILLSFIIIGIPFLIGAICTIVSNVRYKNGKDNKVMAGVLGIFFAGLIGGVLVLIDKR